MTILLFLTPGLDRAAAAQQPADAAIVHQFFPQWLVDEAAADFAAGGPQPFQASAFASVDLDSRGAAEYLVAAFTNGFSAAVRVIKKGSPTAVLVAEPFVPLMAGIYPEVSVVDVDGDKRPEILVTLSSATGFAADWLFKWNAGTLGVIGPVVYGPDGNAATLLGDAEFVDLDGDGLLEIVNPPEPFGLGTPEPSSNPFTVFKLVGGTYNSAQMAFDLFTTFVREAGSPATITQTFSVNNPGGAYVMTIVNGDATGASRVSAGRIEVNGTELVGANMLNQQVRSITVPVSLGSVVNTVTVTLSSAPGAQLNIAIGAE